LAGGGARREYGDLFKLAIEPSPGCVMRFFNSCRVKQSVYAFWLSAGGGCFINRVDCPISGSQEGTPGCFIPDLDFRQYMRSSRGLAQMPGS